MTEHKADPAGDPGPTEVAGNAALIATFYGSRDDASAGPLHETLFRSLARGQDPSPAPWDWQSPSDDAFLRRFDAPAAHDTTIIQLALNAAGDAASAWEAAKRRLEDILGIGGELCTWWGYSLIFQAVTSAGVDADTAFEELVATIRSPGSSQKLWPVAQDNVPGGKAWLLDVPMRNDGLEAAAVYVFLGPTEEEERLVRYFYGPGAQVLMPDLIAHKGYHQMRQYRAGDLQGTYVESLAEFEKTTGGLLRSIHGGAVESHALERLVGAYSRLVDAVARLEELRISMVRQSLNYEAWLKTAGHNAILEYHRDHLNTARTDLELMVSEGRNALGTADTAMSMARIEIDREQARRQRRTGTLLALVGVGLAVAGIVNQSVVRDLLVRLGFRGVSDDVFVQLGVQVFCVVAFASLAAWVTHLIGKHRRRQNVSEDVNNLPSR